MPAASSQGGSVGARNAASAGTLTPARAGCCGGGLCKALREVRRRRSQPSHVSIRDTVREHISIGKRPSSTTDIRQLLIGSGKRPQRTVGASYIYVDRLGHGGFGHVFLAQSRQTGEERAVKEIPLTHVQEDMKFVQSELEAMIRINHPNVVKLYEFFEDEKALYIVTELCNEGDFSVLNHGIDDPDEIRLLFRDLMMAVAYCHDAGIAHRDLKFQNCLIQKTPGLRRVAKVIDFGLSAIHRPDDEADWLSDQLGSELFVAPEIVEGGRHYGVKCDCWSVGVMLYMVLTDEHPCTEDAHKLKRSGLFRAIAAGRIRRQPLMEVDPGAAELLLKLLVKDPERRSDSRSALQCKWLLPDDNRLTWHSNSAMDLSKLERSWFEKHFIGPEPIVDGHTVARLRAFATYTSFERALMTLVAHYAMSRDVEDLRAIFEGLDASKTGSLSREDISDGVRGAGHDLPDSELDEIFQTLDADRSGKVHYTKWLAATIDPAFLSSHKVLEQVYLFFDPERSGRVSGEELSHVLGVDAEVGEVPTEAEFKALLRQLAKNMKLQVLAFLEASSSKAVDDGVEDARMFDPFFFGSEARTMVD